MEIGTCQGAKQLVQAYPEVGLATFHVSFSTFPPYFVDFGVDVKINFPRLDQSQCAKLEWTDDEEGKFGWFAVG